MSDGAILHTCAQGHAWVEQPPVGDRPGQAHVSPSWGYGGTYLPVDDATVCPEPERDEHGAIVCPTCGGRWFRGECPHGPEGGPGCADPPVACGLPAVTSTRWGQENRPWGGRGAQRGIFWLGRRDGPTVRRLVARLGGVSRLWVTHEKVIDLRTGERLIVSSDDAEWIATAADESDLPATLATRWPRRRGGRLALAYDHGPTGVQPPSVDELCGWVDEAIAAGAALESAGQLDLFTAGA